MIKYELIIVWDTGEKETYDYETLDVARQGEANMKMAFGHQIAWTGINERRF